MKPGGALQAKVIQDLKSLSKAYTRSTVLIFFCFKIQCILGRLYCIGLERFVQELLKGGDCKVNKRGCNRNKKKKEVGRMCSCYSETPSRYSENRKLGLRQNHTSL